jgi:predicted phosphodiesterase
MKKFIILIFIIFLIVNCQEPIKETREKEEYPYDTKGEEYANEKFEDSQKYSFPAEPVVNEKEFSFVFISDLHYGKTEENSFFPLIEKKNADWKCDFVIVGGDIAQRGSGNNWKKFIADKTATSMPVYSVMGNHDSNYGKWNNFHKYLHASSYYLEIGNTIFIFLNSSSRVHGSKQMDWVQNVLNNTTKSLKILITHMDEGDAGEELRYLCNNYDIDLVLKGHEHVRLKEEVNNAIWLTVNSANTTLSKMHGEPTDSCYLIIKIVDDTFSYEWFGK